LCHNYGSIAARVICQSPVLEVSQVTHTRRHVCSVTRCRSTWPCQWQWHIHANEDRMCQYAYVMCHWLLCVRCHLMLKLLLVGY